MASLGAGLNKFLKNKENLMGQFGDSVRSFHEPTVAVSANLSKQAGGGKTSRGLASCNMESNFNGYMLLDGGTHLKQQKRTRSIMSKSPKGYYSSADRGYNADLAPNGLTRQEESYVPYRDSGYKEQELIASLKVIRRIMEMAAAGPFNVPVMLMQWRYQIFALSSKVCHEGNSIWELMSIRLHGGQPKSPKESGTESDGPNSTATSSAHSQPVWT